MPLSFEIFIMVAFGVFGLVVGIGIIQYFK